MNLIFHRLLYVHLLLIAVFTTAAGFGQSEGVSVPTPSFSNPGSKAKSTQIPATGTKLDRESKVDRSLMGEAPDPEPVKVPEPIVEKQKEEQDMFPDPTPTFVSPEPTVIAESPSRKDEPEEPVKTSKPRSRPINEAARIDMLEKIGDQLSLRMRSLRKREEILSEREKALIDREKQASEREENIRQIEESLLLREEVVRRREKLPPPQAWRGSDAPSVEAQYAAVLDGKTMQFYHYKNATKATPVASTQKLMTALVVCDDGDLDQIVVVPREATLVEPTKVGIKEGDRYTRRQLLTALLVRSGNDLAAALAIDNAGSVEAFSDKMNLMGERLGLVKSNFKNPHGLPSSGQYSCARDIAIVAFEAYQNPEIREIVSKKNYRFYFNDDTSVLLGNTNRLLRDMEHCNGMKTGFTYAAGRCLVSSISVDGKDRISVVIKTTNSGIWNDSKKLLDWSLDLEMLGPLDSDSFASM